MQLACSILSRSDSCQGDGRQRHLMMHGQCPIPVYSSQIQVRILPSSFYTISLEAGSSFSDAIRLICLKCISLNEKPKYIYIPTYIDTCMHRYSKLHHLIIHVFGKLQGPTSTGNLHDEYFKNIFEYSHTPQNY